MSLALLWPAGLWALAGLLLPLLLHLQRQQQRSPVLFAALRWLSVAARPRQRLRLQQWLLLLLRLLLVAAAALLLAQPVVFGLAQAPHWVLVHPALGLSAVSELAAAGEDSNAEFSVSHIEYRWLLPGFPTIAEARPPAWQGSSSELPVASLLREFDAQLPSTSNLEVRLPELLEGLDGERLALRHRPTLRVLTAPPPLQQPIVGAQLPQKRRWALRVDDAGADSSGGVEQHPALAFVEAAALALAPDAGAEAAMSGVLLDSATLAQPIAASSEALLWMSDQPLSADAQAWVEAGGLALWLRRSEQSLSPRAVERWRSADAEGALYASRQGRGWLLQLSPRLRLESYPELLDPDFPALLADWLRPIGPAADSVKAEDLIVAANSSPQLEAATALDKSLIWLIVLLLVSERIVALSGRRVPR